MSEEDEAAGPIIHESAWVAPSAQLYGKIRVAERASIWHNAVLRAECHHIEIGTMTNLQDFAMVHISYDLPTIIGDFCSITHHATIHGCTIGDNCLVGINAVVMDGAVIGEGSIVGGGAFVTEGKIFPPNSVIGGVPAKLIKTRDNSKANRENAWLYHRNAEGYRRGDHRVWTGKDYHAWRKAKAAEIKAGEDR